MYNPNVTKCEGNVDKDDERFCQEVKIRKNFHCQNRDYYTYNRSHFKIHLQPYNEEKTYRCNYCEDCFSNKENLLHHLKIHTEETPYQYIQQITKEKPYQCSLCGKHFTQKCSLLTHQRIHTGEKPYQCSHCDKCFTQKNSMLAHQRIHTGANLFHCSYCGKCFNKKYIMLTHQKTHTERKPYLGTSLNL
ncbi:unnamed protein product [Meganyctiphanes norvegica]|uniref:Protein krueppel n=1 Tax=Meganyctiphanes norvegica TaxID=48144 RepID=A0AAV2R474_MEGNR